MPNLVKVVGSDGLTPIFVCLTFLNTIVVGRYSF